jgi:hypothetical protein
VKFKPTTFYAAFADGLLEMSGHSFEAIDRTFVVHRKRPPYYPKDKNYLVSDFATGYAIPIANTRNRVIAAHLALEVLAKSTPQDLARNFAKAADIKSTLRIIKG